jgi:hypothetical protein
VGVCNSVAKIEIATSIIVREVTVFIFLFPSDLNRLTVPQPSSLQYICGHQFNHLPAKVGGAPGD